MIGNGALFLIGPTRPHARILRAGVVVSGYDCRLYNDALRDWERHEFDLPNHAR
jgi:hypothetical protein